MLKYDVSMSQDSTAFYTPDGSYVVAVGDAGKVFSDLLTVEIPGQTILFLPLISNQYFQ